MSFLCCCCFEIVFSLWFCCFMLVNFVLFNIISLTRNRTHWLAFLKCLSYVCVFFFIKKFCFICLMTFYLDSLVVVVFLVFGCLFVKWITWKWITWIRLRRLVSNELCHNNLVRKRHFSFCLWKKYHTVYCQWLNVLIVLNGRQWPEYSGCVSLLGDISWLKFGYFSCRNFNFWLHIKCN